MLHEVSDLVKEMKRNAMDAMLPRRIDEEMRQKFLSYAERMTPKQIEEVGEKFQKARKEAFERKMAEWKAEGKVIF